MFDFDVRYTLPVERISDLLCSALEGGSNYWYHIEQFIKPINFNNSEEGTTEEKCFRHLDYPINEGGALMISVPEDEDGKLYCLDLQSIRSGMKVMAKRYPRHMMDLIRENDDACTGDVFLQCCLFGEVIFG